MPPRLQQIRHVLPSDPFFPTITENQLLYSTWTHMNKGKSKLNLDQGSGQGRMGNSDLLYRILLAWLGSLWALWWPGQPMGAASMRGKGWGALKLCQLQRKVKLHPQVLSSSNGESSLTCRSALGNAISPCLKKSGWVLLGCPIVRRLILSNMKLIFKWCVACNSKALLACHLSVKAHIVPHVVLSLLSSSVRASGLSEQQKLSSALTKTLWVI